MNNKTKVEEKSISEWKNIIDEWIYDEKDRYILKRKMLDNISFEELAREQKVDLSTQQTKIRTYKAQAKLFKHI